MKLFDFAIEFTVSTTYDVEVQAETEDKAVQLAWERFKKDLPQAEWDITTVDYDEFQHDEVPE